MRADIATNTVEQAGLDASYVPWVDEPGPDLADYLGPPALCDEPGCEGGDIETADGWAGTCPVCEGSGEAP